MIKTATVEDIDTIAKFRYEMFNDIGTTHLLIDNFIEETVTFYKNAYKTGDCIHFVAEIDGELIGCAGAIIKSDFPNTFFKSNRYGYIMDVFVHKSHRKKGIAKSLVEELMIWFKEKGISTVKLDASQEGVPLYEKIGFVSSKEMSMSLND